MFRIELAKKEFRALMGNGLTEDFGDDDEANTYVKKGVALFFIEHTPPPVCERSSLPVSVLR